MHIGMRGRDEHHKLTFGDFSIQSDSNGLKYVVFNERDTKTRNGQAGGCRPFRPKMWATPENPEQCPVALFEKFIENQPPSMCLLESPFYLAINCQASDKCWYKRQPMGRNKIGTIMNTLAEKGNLQGKKTNHSARKTMITLLSKQNVPDT